MNKIAASDLAVGQTLSLIVASAGVSAVAVQTRIKDASPKAVCLESLREDGQHFTAWFPRRAIVGASLADGHVTARFAAWFKPEGWGEKFLRLCERFY